MPPRAALSTSAALGLHDTRLGLIQDGSDDKHPPHGNGCMMNGARQLWRQSGVRQFKIMLCYRVFSAALIVSVIMQVRVQSVKSRVDEMEACNWLDHKLRSCLRSSTLRISTLAFVTVMDVQHERNYKGGLLSPT
jgi:hypothetical protein